VCCVLCVVCCVLCVVCCVLCVVCCVLCVVCCVCCNTVLNGPGKRFIFFYEKKNEKTLLRFYKIP
jgi:hypothetical protein